MSIIIKGMEMPTHCLRDCPVCDCERMVCKADSFARPVDWTTDTIPDWCPLTPLPEKHGRLTDVDALMNNIGDVPYKGSVRRVLLSAPTIVPAEGGEADDSKL